jgi:hypothetical protein
MPLSVNIHAFRCTNINVICALLGYYAADLNIATGARNQGNINVFDYRALPQTPLGMLRSIRYMHCRFFFSNGSTAPWGPRPPHFSRLHDHTHFRHTTLGKTPLDERPARRRDLYLTTHNTHKMHYITFLKSEKLWIPKHIWPQEFRARDCGHVLVVLDIFVHAVSLVTNSYVTWSYLLTDTGPT